MKLDELKQKEREERLEAFHEWLWSEEETEITFNEEDLKEIKEWEI